MKSSPPEKSTAQKPATDVQEDWLLLCTTYAVIVAGALLLASTEPTVAYFVAAVVFCVGHALIVGPGGPIYLSRGVGSFMALGALAFGLLQPEISSVHVSHALAHFLIFVQLIKLYGPHERRDLRLIQVAALFEVLVAGIWAMSLVYLPIFVLTALALMMNFAAVAMVPGGSLAPSTCPPDEDGAAAWGRLFAAIWLPAVSVLALTILLFMLLPRFHDLSGPMTMMPEQMIGYGENVSLHDVGHLRQSQDEALRVQFTDARSPGAQPLRPSRPLMRGVSLPIYSNGQWLGYKAACQQAPKRHPDWAARPEPDMTSRRIYRLEGQNVLVQAVRQKVTVESKPINALFALYRPAPIMFEGGPAYRDPFYLLSDDLRVPKVLAPGEFYELVSLVPTFSPAQLRAAGTPRPGGRWTFFWDLPDDIRPVLEKTAGEIARLYPAQTDCDRVMAAQRYLQSGFQYTYDLPELGGQEPIEAFLSTTRLGSCEQFSTALALILRVWEIPTRLVVGYKDGEYETASQTYTFRDRDAHAWVEVFFTGLGWVEFDPTPGSEKTGGASGSGQPTVTQFTSYLRRALAGLVRSARVQWTSNVIGYNRSKQRHLLYGLSEAANSLANEATSAFRALWPGMPDLGLWQIALLVVSITFAGLSVYLGAGWFLKNARLLRPGEPGESTLRFYRELLAILRRKGLSRPPQATPREFARAASAELSEANEGDPAVRAALDLVTDCYYLARFGGYELTETQVQDVRQALRTLAAAKRVRPR